MSDIQSSRSLEDKSSMIIDMYKENISIQERKIQSLSKEIQELLNISKEKDKRIKKLQEKIDEQDQIIKELQNSSVISRKSNEKSELFQIIESFQEKSLHNSSIHELEEEFDNIEKIQDSLKVENQDLREKFQKFEEIYPNLNKISNLTQRLYLVFQNYILGEQITLEFLMASPEKIVKQRNILQHFCEDINKTKEILEKIVQMISDHIAEKFGESECVCF